MAWYPSAGSDLAIGTTALLPATDVYNVIGELESIPAFGDSYSKVQFAALPTRNNASRKGTREGFDLDLMAGMDASDPGQLAFEAACSSDAYFNFRYRANNAVPAIVSTVTISIAAPGVVTLNNHGFTTDTQVTFSTSGALPTGLAPATTYFVRNPTTNTFELSATRGGTTSITTTGTQSGVQTVTSIPTPSIYYFKGLAASFQPQPSAVNDPTKVRMVIFGQPGTMLKQIRSPNPVGV